MQSVTQQAMNLVGNDQPTDWELAPEKHAAALGAGAEPLKEILLKPDIGKIITDFRVADRAAGRAQKTYKRLARLAAWTGFAAALIGSVVLMFAYLHPPGIALTAAAAAQALLLLVSLGTSLLIGSRQPFEAWMLKRAEAENARIALFDRVMSEHAPTTPGAVPGTAARSLSQTPRALQTGPFSVTIEENGHGGSRDASGMRRAIKLRLHWGSPQDGAACMQNA